MCLSFDETCLEGVWIPRTYEQFAQSLRNTPPQCFSLLLALGMGDWAKSILLFWLGKTRRKIPNLNLARISTTKNNPYVE